ncbi:septation ring formation regulator EzrA [Caldicellulosiruptoraceae bacterium PP1]
MYKSNVLYNDPFEYQIEERQNKLEEVNKKNQIRKELKNVKNRSRKEYIKRIIIISILGSLIFLMIAGFVQITFERDRLYSLQKELKEQIDINKELKIKINTSVNLIDIEKIAKEKYNMNDIIDSQVIYVSINNKNNNSSTIAKDQKAEYDNNIVTSIINFIKKVF